MKKYLHHGISSTLVILGCASPIAAGTEDTPPPLENIISPGENICFNAVAESKLKEREIQGLGSEHAAEHARDREAHCVEVRQEVASRTGYRRFIAATLEPVRGFMDQIAQFVDKLMGNVQAATGAPSQVGQWTDPIDFETNPPQPAPSVQIQGVGISAVLLHTGKVLFWGPEKDGNTGLTYLWTPPAINATGDAAKGVSKQVTIPISASCNPELDPECNDTNIWCAGQTLLADGRVLVVGGNLAYPANGVGYRGFKRIYTFNPGTSPGSPGAETWTRQPDLKYGRWYPTTTKMADGRVVITSGFDENNLKTDAVEVFTPSENLNGVGTVVDIEQDRSFGGLYPHQFLLPDGELYVASGARMPTSNTSTLTPKPVSNIAGWLWRDIVVPAGAAQTSSHNGQASSALLPGTSSGSDKFIIMGGRTGNSTSAVTEINEVFTADRNTAAADGAWELKSPMLRSVPFGLNPDDPDNRKIGRRNQNTVILPDGTLLIVGGQSHFMDHHEPQPEALLYDPAKDIPGFPNGDPWTRMASQQEARDYHSIAVLLPDGRVVSAGDDGPAKHPGTGDSENNRGGSDTDTFEIFSPPYLFQGGTRPVINSVVPEQFTWGNSFVINTATSATGAKAVLIAPGATTHGNDMHQRYVPLAISANPGGGIRATAPANANIAPPGHYMLFLLDDRGVPSVAKWVRLDTRTLQFSTANYTVSENIASGGITITVRRSGIRVGNGDVWVNYATSNGTATAGSDYTAMSGSFLFAAGEFSKTFTIPIINDSIIETTDETINLTLSSPSPTGEVILGAQNIAVLTIRDNEVPRVKFSASKYLVNENESAGTAVVTVTRSGSNNSPVSVTYTVGNVSGVSNGTATAGMDYTAISGMLSFGMGDYVPKTFTVPITNDTINEEGETINLSLSNPSSAVGAIAGPPSVALLTIVDNDEPPPP